MPACSQQASMTTLSIFISDRMDPGYDHAGMTILGYLHAVE
jgi:hypothetical protein